MENITFNHLGQTAWWSQCAALFMLLEDTTCWWEHWALCAERRCAGCFPLRWKCHMLVRSDTSGVDPQAHTFLLSQRMDTCRAEAERSGWKQDLASLTPPHQKSSFKNPPSRWAIDLPEAGLSAERGCREARRRSSRSSETSGSRCDQRKGEDGSVLPVLVSNDEDSWRMWAETLVETHQRRVVVMTDASWAGRRLYKDWLPEGVSVTPPPIKSRLTT